MRNPKKFYVMFDVSGEFHSLTPYSLNAQQLAAEKGLTCKIFEPGSKGYDLSLAAWKQYLPELFPGESASDDPSPDSARAAAARTPPAGEDQCPEVAARRKFEASPELQTQFVEFDVYWAYTRAAASGQVRC